ncbi:unnamed protein product [Danaus chrysippus]|uniref:(African queen) hypothetical protein n=1 Tax=Danaus chrysippus TaxID=151541 RepID=A0A8J2Q810_9NEOP|nr:unnamed protein product [Danaus chrysippus]
MSPKSTLSVTHLLTLQSPVSKRSLRRRPRLRSVVVCQWLPCCMYLCVFRLLVRWRTGVVPTSTQNAAALCSIRLYVCAEEVLACLNPPPPTYHFPTPPRSELSPIFSTISIELKHRYGK